MKKQSTTLREFVRQMTIWDMRGKITAASKLPEAFIFTKQEIAFEDELILHKLLELEDSQALLRAKSLLNTFHCMWQHENMILGAQFRQWAEHGIPINILKVTPLDYEKKCVVVNAWPHHKKLVYPATQEQFIYNKKLLLTI